MKKQFVPQPLVEKNGRMIVTDKYRGGRPKKTKGKSKITTIQKPNHILTKQEEWEIFEALRDMFEGQQYLGTLFTPATMEWIWHSMTYDVTCDIGSDLDYWIEDFFKNKKRKKYPITHVK